MGNVNSSAGKDGHPTGVAHCGRSSSEGQKGYRISRRARWWRTRTVLWRFGEATLRNSGDTSNNEHTTETGRDATGAGSSWSLAPGEEPMWRR